MYIVIVDNIENEFIFFNYNYFNIENLFVI